MKKAFAAVIITAAMAASFAAGCIVTMHAAQPVGPSTYAQGRSGYVISYRYGPIWFNELYD